MQTDLTRPIIGIENRTAQEVFDIMCDRIRSRLSASIPAEIGELVERLESPAAVLYTEKAASALRALSVRNGELCEALGPFATAAEFYTHRGRLPDDQLAELKGRWDDHGHMEVRLVVGDFRRARSAFSKGGNGNG